MLVKVVHEPLLMPPVVVQVQHEPLLRLRPLVLVQVFHVPLLRPPVVVQALHESPPVRERVLDGLPLMVGASKKPLLRLRPSDDALGQQ